MEVSEMMGMFVPGIVWILVIALIIYTIVKRVKNNKAAQTGEDLAKVKGMLTQFVPDPENYTFAYAMWTEVEHHYRKTITHYWYYSIGFNNDRIYIAPLKLNKDGFSVERSFCLEKSEIGVVNANEKNLFWMTLYDADLKEMISLRVEPKHLKSDKYHPVNIRQEQETAAFQNFVRTWLHDVNDPKGIEATGRIGNPVKKGKKK